MYCDECGAELQEGSPGCPRCGGGGVVRRRTVIRLGRAPDNDIVVEAPSVSRHHAELRRGEDGRLRLVDLRSQAGTFVDGHRIAEHLLGVGSAVSLGSARVPDDALRTLVAELSPPAQRPMHPAGGPDDFPVQADGRRATIVRFRRALTHAWTRAKDPVSLGGVVTLGVLNVLFGGAGLLFPTLFWLGWRIDRDAPGGADWLLVLAAASALHQIILFVGGMGLILRRRWGRVLSLAWATIACAALVGAAVMAGAGTPFDFGELGRAVLLAATGVLIIYPVLLLFLLNIPTYRAALCQGDHVGDSVLSAYATPSHGGSTDVPRAPERGPGPGDAKLPDGMSNRLIGTHPEATR